MSYIETPSNRDSNREFIRISMNAELLSRERELELAYKWRDENDEVALHELVLAYMRLVISTASKFRNYGLPMNDLVQEGSVGLMQAAERFEPEREVRFSTYASWWVRSAMQDYILRNWSVVRTGTTAAQKALFFNFRRLRARIHDSGNGQLDDEGRNSIAKELSVNVNDVVAMEIRLSGSDQSLNSRISPNGEDEWQDFLADETPSPEEVVTLAHDNKTRSIWLAHALAELTDREQVIIKERRLRDDGRTLEELGRKLGISKERVRQIEHRALEKLKTSLLKRTVENDLTMKVD